MQWGCIHIQDDLLKRDRVIVNQPVQAATKLAAIFVTLE